MGCSWSSLSRFRAFCEFCGLCCVDPCRYVLLAVTSAARSSSPSGAALYAPAHSSEFQNTAYLFQACSSFVHTRCWGQQQMRCGMGATAIATLKMGMEGLCLMVTPEAQAFMMPRPNIPAPGTKSRMHGCATRLAHELDHNCSHRKRPGAA
jgi:hypothetical protein